MISACISGGVFLTTSIHFLASNFAIAVQPSSHLGALPTVDTTSNAAAAAGSVLLTALSTDISSMTGNLTSCQGIFADYCGRMKDNLTAFSVHASAKPKAYFDVDV
jgi:hypothetical protein